MEYVEGGSAKPSQPARGPRDVLPLLMTRLFCVQVAALLTGVVMSRLPDGLPLLERLAQPSSSLAFFVAGVIAMIVLFARDVLRFIGRTGAPLFGAFYPIQQTLFVAAFIPLLGGRSMIQFLLTYPVTS